MTILQWAHAPRLIIVAVLNGLFALKTRLTSARKAATNRSNPVLEGVSQINTSSAGRAAGCVHSTCRLGPETNLTCDMVDEVEEALHMQPIRKKSGIVIAAHNHC